MDPQQLDYPSDPLAHVDWPSDPLGYEEGFHRQDFVEKFPQGGGDTLNFPFKITQSGADTVTVATGTVGGYIPSSLSGDKTITGTDYLYIDVEYDEDDTLDLIQSVSYGQGASLPADSSTHKYILIGIVTESGGEITLIQQSLAHSLGFAYCQGSLYYWAI